MLNSPAAPFAAIFAGIAIGFTILIPFGGLPAKRAAAKQPATHEVRCDLMGCTVSRLDRENGPSVDYSQVTHATGIGP